MLHFILNIIFSVPYLVAGITVAALLDLGIHYTKATTRFTFLEIWGCIMFWPIISIFFVISFFKGDGSN